jgi:hypothetical protein
MSPSYRRIVPLVLALLAFAAVPAARATRVVRIKSTVTISKKAPAFHGRVLSPNGACERGRKVKLFRVRSGPDKLLGSTHTHKGGTWRIPTDLHGSAAYYAKVARRSEGTAGTIYVCRGDRSGTVTVD